MQRKHRDGELSVRCGFCFSASSSELAKEVLERACHVEEGQCKADLCVSQDTLELEHPPVHFPVYFPASAAVHVWQVSSCAIGASFTPSLVKPCCELNKQRGVALVAMSRRMDIGAYVREPCTVRSTPAPASWQPVPSQIQVVYLHQTGALTISECCIITESSL